jgi:osmotically-inducible protein OsmY
MKIRTRDISNSCKYAIAAAAASAGMLSVGFAAEPSHPARNASTATAATWVTPAAIQSSDDIQLMDRVVNALNSDRSLRGSKIEVVALNGQVTLGGSVGGDAISDKAAKDARAVAAPNKVINSLQTPSG